VGGVGEIAPATATGVVHAMRAAAERVWGTPRLAGRRIAVQGVGACGAAAARLLVAEGASLVLGDVDRGRVAIVAATIGRGDITTVAPEAIASVPVDIFAPCAFGGAIDDTVADHLVAAGVRVVAGSANNVMADRAAEARLVDGGIVYVPDLVANAGGCILDADRFDPRGHDPGRVAAALSAIGARTHEVLDRAEGDGVLPSEAAVALARERLDEARGPGGARTGAPQTTAAA
jgi:glutamate dehydrogenase/leucine dehydrogenase